MKQLYNRVVKVLSRIPTDKYIHTILTMIIASVLMHVIPFGVLPRFALSVAITIAIGVAKELYDKGDYGLFDVKDLYADIFGAALGALMAI